MISSDRQFKVIRAEAPTRVDLAGGTVDIPPLYLFHWPAITVNIAVEIKVRATISEAEETIIISRDQNETAVWKNPQEISWLEHPRLELILRLVKLFEPKENLKIEIESEAPAGSGLGGSSTIAIALTAALAKWFSRELSKEELVDYAKSVETQTIKVPTGYQDYWGAVYGGIHAYHMGIDHRVKMAALASPAFRQELERHALLVYVGQPHFSGTNNWELLKRDVDGDAATVNFFENLKENGLLMKKALESESVGYVAMALNKDWETRKAMLPGMTTSEIEKLTEEAFKNGALALRACGAGGGGCVFLLIDPDKREKIVSAVESLNMRILPFKIAAGGVSVGLDAAPGGATPSS